MQSVVINNSPVVTATHEEVEEATSIFFFTRHSPHSLRSLPTQSLLRFHIHRRRWWAQKTTTATPPLIPSTTPQQRPSTAPQPTSTTPKPMPAPTTPPRPPNGRATRTSSTTLPSYYSCTHAITYSKKHKSRRVGDEPTFLCNFRYKNYHRIHTE